MPLTEEQREVLKQAEYRARLAALEAPDSNGFTIDGRPNIRS